MPNQVKDCNIGNNSTYVSTPISATTDPIQFLTKDLFQYNDPKEFQLALQEIMDGFIASPFSDDTETRQNAWIHYKLIQDFFTKLEHFNPRNKTLK